MNVDKQFTMACSSYGEPWYTTGEITREVLAPLGYEVSIEQKSGSIENPRWIARGDAPLGASMAYYVRWARNSEHTYVGESFPDLRAVASIFLPHWEMVAATWESGINSLHDVRERKMPVRVFIGNPKTPVGGLAFRILEHYGLSLELIESWGGKFLVSADSPSAIQNRDFDLIILVAYNGNTPMCRPWVQGSIFNNLRYLGLEPALIDRMVEEYGFHRGSLPRRIFRGVEHDIPTVVHHTVIVYGKADLPDDFVYNLAKAYDTNRHVFRETPLPISWDPQEALKYAEIPLHPAAERYYKEKGYI
jgi:uncharacterized protein